MQWGKTLLCEKFCWDTEAPLKTNDRPCGKECTSVVNGSIFACDTDCE